MGQVPVMRNGTTLVNGQAFKPGGEPRAACVGKTLRV